MSEYLYYLALTGAWMGAGAGVLMLLAATYPDTSTTQSGWLVIIGAALFALSVPLLFTVMPR